jgi:hypothetical protein
MYDARWQRGGLAGWMHKNTTLQANRERKEDDEKKLGFNGRIAYLAPKIKENNQIYMGRKRVHH